MSVIFKMCFTKITLYALLFNLILVLSEVLHPDEYQYEHLDVMKLVNGGHFLRGINDPNSDSGEYPMVQTQVKSFYVDIYPVSNAHFRRFIQKRPKFKTTAHLVGSSWVLDVFLEEKVKMFSSKPAKGQRWIDARNASWDKPEGPGSTYENRMKHPVIHVSMYDAAAYCSSLDKRLPTEDEWEFAARGGLHAKEFPWGDNYKRNRSNLWQGDFPDGNTRADHWWGTSPVDFYPAQNNYGIHDFIGNVWEWTSTKYYERMIPKDLQELKYVVKGGSYIDSKYGKVNTKVRTSQRMGLEKAYTAHNVGFRCVKSATRYWKDRSDPMRRNEL